MRGTSSFNARLACFSARRWPASLHRSWSAASAVRPSSADWDRVLCVAAGEIPLPVRRHSGVHGAGLELRRFGAGCGLVRPRGRGAWCHRSVDRLGQPVGLDQSGAQACGQPRLDRSRVGGRRRFQQDPQRGRCHRAAETGRHRARTCGGRVSGRRIGHGALQPAQEDRLSQRRCQPHRQHLVERGLRVPEEGIERCHQGPLPAVLQRWHAYRLQALVQSSRRLDVLGYASAAHPSRRPLIWPHVSRWPIR